MTKAEATRKYWKRAYMALRHNPSKTPKGVHGVSYEINVWDYIDDAAWETGRSRSWVLCEIVKDYMRMLDAEHARMKKIRMRKRRAA